MKNPKMPSSEDMSSGCSLLDLELLSFVAAKQGEDIGSELDLS